MAASPEALEYLSSAQALLQQNRLDEAESAYRHALFINPELAAAYVGLADISLAQGQTDDATMYYEQAFHFDPQNAILCYNRTGDCSAP